MGFQDRYDATLAELARACEAAGRDACDVRVLAVSKTVGVDAVAEALACGCTDFGENRPDMLAEKAEAFPQASWHFIGNIQSRKIPEIARFATLVHSLCERRHLERFDREAALLGRTIDVLLEVNVSGEASKSGMAPADVADFMAYAASFDHVRVRGLMTMAPQGDLDVARRCFEELAALRDDVRESLPADQAALFNELSMGMSEDWREAVASGATIVRIGRALFSDVFVADATVS
ncbi:YggS family pyridoxal phosphate-dependent enzyme [Eggerthellaceae bacterium zg-887]|uniref:YggS family pyridoxal phosphate-dependent enzyme n=1 Tax=Xiamenia xianingshaonis TaxID=2682776 RepID=UPI001407D271|nr:YggS family pyridoxal phosphate-dependent enzyme [Xiamenia xianingshaonis]NHM15490.1 YggS family pyridoxal phosphate-dependent enzyme [Xiamenia xianingshaonis]